MAWTDRTAPLLEGMPSRRRAVIEAVFVAFVALAGEVSGAWIAAIVLLAAGAAIVQPWRTGKSVPSRALATLALVVAIVVPVALAEAMHGSMAGARKIGIAISAVEPRADDPPAAGGVLEVSHVEPGDPADGILRVGDRITAIDGAPLDPLTPSKDLVARLQKAGDTARLDVLRDHRVDAVIVPVPRPMHGPAAWTALGRFAGDHFLAGAALRAACVIALVFLLLRSDGQSFGALGISRRGLGLDILVGLALTFGTFATAMVSGLLVQGASALAHSKLVDREAVDRPTLLLDLFGGTSLWAFAAAIAVTATFEEVVFRGFLLPRLRHATHSWAVAVALAAILFGSGHLYEGWTAVVQTTALGVFFGVAFLFRGRLVPVIIAHAAFDVTVFAMLTWLQRSGLLEKAQQMLDHR